MSLTGAVRAENVQRVELISSLLAGLLSSAGETVLVEVSQFESIIELLYQVFHR